MFDGSALIAYRLTIQPSIKAIRDYLSFGKRQQMTGTPSATDHWHFSWISARALPWPVERQRSRRADLPGYDAVMRCRARWLELRVDAAASHRASGLARPNKEIANNEKP
jgi:hypothetical protein